MERAPHLRIQHAWLVLVPALIEVMVVSPRILRDVISKSPQLRVKPFGAVSEERVCVIAPGDEKTGMEVLGPVPAFRVEVLDQRFPTVSKPKPLAGGA